MNVLKGGYPVYGIGLGIIMLDCTFPRPVGDIGNAMTFPYPVHYEVLEGFPIADLTRHGRQEAVEALIAAGRRLEKRGARGVVTSCGLLIRYQNLLAEALNIPAATSSLLLLPFLNTLIPRPRKIGIITADAGIINREVLNLAGCPETDRVVIKGAEDCITFRSGIMESSPPFELDTDRLKDETVSLCRDLMVQEPDTGVLLLECTNLAPYRVEIVKALSVPVFDITHLADLICGATAVETPRGCGWF